MNASARKPIPRTADRNRLPVSGAGQNGPGCSWRIFAKALLDASGSAIFAVDPSGTVVLSNRPVQQRLGLIPGSLLPETRDDIWSTVKRVLEDRQPVRELPVQAGGIAYLARLSPMQHDASVIGVLCELEDRTELEKTTRRMRVYQELSRELDAIISSSDDGLWICDAAGTILRMNAASERLNMLRAEDVTGRNIDTLVDEGYIDHSVTRKVILSGRRENLLQETRSGRKLMLTGNPVFNPAGELIRVVVNERDITEIDALREELEAQVARNDQIRKRMQALQLDELASGKIVARSANMVQALRQARKVSRVDSTVLIQGESGSGKGVLANLIHSSSARAAKPMVQVNCGAIPENLVESELFGYEKGAFTGAGQKGKPGYFELADGGVLFLDEVAELPLAAQVKLLRFLENGQVMRVGGTRPRTLDVRIICATHRDLEKMVESGAFRLDLFYRLNVIPIVVPPLRARDACKLSLIQHFITHFSNRLKGDAGKPPRLTRRAMDALLGYDFPGNVRELMNICERLVVMAESSRIDVEDLPAVVTAGLSADFACDIEMMESGQTLPQIVAAMERRLIAQALEKHGTQARAAEVLGINQSTIARKLRRPRHG